MKFFDLNKRLWQWVLLLFVSFVWGASFILMKRGLESFSPIQLGTMRIFFAFLFLLPLFFKRIKKLKKEYIKPLIFVSILGNLIPAILFALAQTKVSSSMAGMLNTMFPLIALIIGTIFYKTKTEKHRIFGIFVGLVGTIGIIFSNGFSLSNDGVLFSGFIVIATIFYAISINEIKFNLAKLDGITITVFAFMISGPIAGIYLLFSDFSDAIATPNFKDNLIYVILLAFGGSAVAVTLFYLLIDYVDVIFASLTTYIIPIFAIIWGLFDDETVTTVQILFMIIVFIGIYLVNKKGKYIK